MRPDQAFESDREEMGRAVAVDLRNETIIWLRAIKATRSVVAE